MNSVSTQYTDKIKQEQIRTLFMQSVYLFLGLLILMTGVMLYFWNTHNNQHLLIWYLLNMGLLLARAVFVRQFHKIKPEGQQIYRWGKVFAFSSFLSGCLWGMFPVIFIDPDDLLNMSLIIVVLLGMLTSSIVPLSSFRPAYIAYSIPSLLPLCLMLFASGVSNHLILGGFLFTAMVIYIAYSFVIHRNFAASLLLRFENLDLVNDLAIQKQRAEKANQDKSRFLAATSHDLRQPLHAMDLYMGALGNVLTSDEQKELLQKTQSSSKALTELLNAIMDVSRLDAGSVDIDKKSINLKVLLEEISLSVQPQLDKQGMLLKQAIDDVNVYSDPVLLARVFRNLISNALMHSEGTEIKLSSEIQDEDITVCVIDNGKGIVAMEIENIFSEFYQLNNPERDRNKGLGLGLAIVQRITQQLGHEINVDSGLNKGSRFCISLPITHAEDMPAVEYANQEFTDLSGLFAIIIEDEVDVRDAMRYLLRSWDCEVLVGDSIDAVMLELEQSDYATPDVIISDYRLRENRTGLEAIHRLREYFNESIPAVVVTGDTSPAIAEDIEGAHCRLVYKPVNAGQFQSVIAAAIETS